jgi:hypothetical protein
MSWLRLDDGFTKHPKFSGWTAAQKWAWLEVMEYCARYETGGRIPHDLGVMPRSTTTSLLERASQAGLLDRADDGGLVIHDWLIYNGATIGEKVAYYLAKHPDASANEVHKALGGTREVVLSEVTRQRKPGSLTGTTEPGEGGTTEPGQGGSESGSETGTHARGPVPSRPLANNGTALPALELQALPNYATPEEQLWRRLCVAADVATKPAEIAKLERAVRAHKCTERDIVCAIDAATGPGVNDPLAVALAELVARAKERTPA